MRFPYLVALFVLVAGVLGGSRSQRAPSLLSRDLAVDGVNATIVSLALASDHQSYYVVLKTGEISFRVALDTASSDIWILSSLCTTNTCFNAPRYPLTYQSPTFSSVNANSTKYQVKYADGTAASGFVAKEDIHVGNMTLPQQAFGMITETNVVFTDQESGILGLGFPRLSKIDRNVAGSAPFLTTLSEQGLLNYPLFGLSLTRDTSGTLSLGAIDGTVVTNITRIEWNEVVQFPPLGVENNVSTYWHWALPLQGISVHSRAVSLSPSYPTITDGLPIAMFDVGVSGIYGPWADVAKIFEAIEESRLVDASGQWAVPCDTRVLMTFTFGTQNFTLQPTDYLIGPTSGNPTLCLSWPRAVTPSPDGIDWQLGSPFLRTVYSIFSYGIDMKEPPMIGLYALNNSVLAPSPAEVSAFFSSISVQIPTTLPNYLLPTPTISTPPYSLNSSITAPTGGIVSSGLANSTYSPIFAQEVTNLSALPIITAEPTVATFTLTDPAGGVSTTTSHLSMASVALGVPPGWNSAPSTTRLPSASNFMLPILIAWTLYCI
ncbi:pepsinogen c [Moniliophthora roreri MCA 2997]|uniref:Pepsinogen c n=1 Tax=Moniliophthora roreri (strain MCA 2997) TaxID=1381753 RepID=V2X7L6_MONRO|nr:pepsinogen c [Moniliophthora roreri MCA 2997]